MTETVYVEFPGGTREPDGYITEATVAKRIPGWAQVVLTAAGLSWKQWVRESQLLSEDEVTEV